MDGSLKDEGRATHRSTNQALAARQNPYITPDKPKDRRESHRAQEERRGAQIRTAIKDLGSHVSYTEVVTCTSGGCGSNEENHKG